jgi:vanillate monooxygenase ferredoxin subunit
LSGAWRRLVLRQCEEAAENIRLYELMDPAGGTVPAFAAGAHLRLRLPGGIVRHYSLANDPAERERYLLAVLREPAGCGGSVAIHDSWRPGQLVETSLPINHFPLAPAASFHTLIAGGIGITPIKAMVHSLVALKAEYELYYCVRRTKAAVFVEELRHLAGPRLHLLCDNGDPAKGLDVRSLLVRHKPGEHVYVCGPRGLIQAVRDAARHWPAGSVHFESFAAEAPIADPAAGAFEVELAADGTRYRVEAGESILEVLERHGRPAPSLCREGYCGTCLVPVLKGVPEHRDTVLSEEERQEGRLIALCCSRALTGRIVLDL